MTYYDNINQLTQQYNNAIVALENSYKLENRSVAYRSQKSFMLKKEYSEKYESLAREYRQKRLNIIHDFEQANPKWVKGRKFWKRLLIAAAFMTIMCCMGALPTEESAEVSTLVSAETPAWDADNIPIPYLQDSTQFVSNPDSVLTPSAVDRMNATLHKMHLELGVQSVVIVVNHIKNDDPFRFAQDVGNKYGVGYNNRGLVIVVGYQDHSINMSPGRALEADLTDAECHRLEQEYVVPAMRAEKPDSGMIYLVEATYSTLKKKELPQMSSLLSPSQESEDESATVIGMSALVLIGLFVLFLKKNKKYHWIGNVGTAYLLANPFIDFSDTGSSSSSRRGGGWSSGSSHHSSGGGGFSGGSFGGGSFGGGGATSRW